MPFSRISRRHDDPGLQPERTSLSWYRTLFLIIGVSMLFLRLGFIKNDLILVAGSIILLLCNIGVCIYAYKRNLFDERSTVLTSYGSVIVKKMICFAIIFSALVFALSIIMSSYNRIFESYLI
ncbi:DUF202 domain-containing protein [Vibrio sp. 1-Bac 57]|uniref:DUF202 domain-containing protein n=1 Tax=uncultured Psychromonas sp. TaxID=173974 RepID=UPI00262485CD|nr:DUF202 domain-containing protein [uncultured Psychromonas sp.]